MRFQPIRERGARMRSRRYGAAVTLLATAALSLACAGANAQLVGPNTISFQATGNPLADGFSPVIVPSNSPAGTYISLPVNGNAVDTYNASTGAGDGGLVWLQQVTQVDLTIKGTSANSVVNGNLSVELIAPGGQFAVLLNRSGVGCNGHNNTLGSGCTSSSPGQNSTYSTFGYNDNNGFNVSFTDTASNGDIHAYQSVVGAPSGGQLTGTWQPDGRNIIDTSTPGVFSSTPRTAMLADFTNTGSPRSESAYGTWQLFVADSEPGSAEEVTGVNIYVTGYVPAPPGMIVMATGLLGVPVMSRVNRFRNATRFRAGTGRSGPRESVCDDLTAVPSVANERISN